MPGAADGEKLGYPLDDAENDRFKGSDGILLGWSSELTKSIRQFRILDDLRPHLTRRDPKFFSPSEQFEQVERLERCLPQLTN